MTVERDLNTQTGNDESVNTDATPQEPTPDARQSSEDDAARAASEDEGPDTRNKEAAKYRTRLRETEGQRDALQARVDAYQREEAAMLASPLLAVGTDLFDVGLVELTDLLDETGEVDPNKVADAARLVAAGRPRLQANPWPPTGQDRMPGLGGPGRPESPWADWLDAHGHSRDSGWQYVPKNRR